MLRVDRDKIGPFVAELIAASEYRSDRQFGIEYLRRRYNDDNPDEGTIQNMQNRICQIKKGNKGLQLEDLPIFAEMLHVSIDDILSAGTAIVAPSSPRRTNYSIAFSKDPEEWESYIHNKDNPFCNPDEFNKTVIDYALEAGNYPFLKYLMEKEYIYFVGDEKHYYFTGFGAGTKVKRKSIGMLDPLDSLLKEQDDLRFKMIALAIKNEDSKDFSMFEELRAREVPFLYTVNPLQEHNLVKMTLPASNNVNQMISGLANADENVLAYFFEEFDVASLLGELKNTFIFPYAGQVLDALIKGKRKDLCKEFLEKAIAHNKSVKKKVQSYTDRTSSGCRVYFGGLPGSEIYDDAFIKKETWKYYNFYPATGLVSYYSTPFLPDIRGFVANAIPVTAKSSDPTIQALIDKLNDSYAVFNNYLKNKES